jgi:hypothetical protein
MPVRESPLVLVNVRNRGGYDVRLGDGPWRSGRQNFQGDDQPA